MRYLTASSVAGGLLMAIIGLLYLAFEDLVLSDFCSAPKQADVNASGLRRTLTGIQVRLAPWHLRIRLAKRATGRPSSLVDTRDALQRPVSAV